MTLEAHFNIQTNVVLRKFAVLVFLFIEIYVPTDSLIDISTGFEPIYYIVVTLTSQVCFFSFLSLSLLLSVVTITIAGYCSRHKRFAVANLDI